MRPSRTKGVCCLVALCWCMVASVTMAAEIFWQPVSASGTYVIVGNEIRLTGGNQRVFLELKLSGWAPTNLVTWQATLDSSDFGASCVGGGNDGSDCYTDFDCFGGGTCVPTRSGPIAAASVACSGSSECVTAFGTGSTCNAGVGFCKAGFQDTQRSDFVFPGSISAVDTSTPAYRYGSQGIGTSVADGGSTYYGGTLVIDVPANAAGSYIVGLLPEGASTFMSSTSGPITPVNTTQAIITVVCESNSDCDDGSACTTDVCQASGVCVSTPNFDDASFCCDPADGSLTALDDGNDCTANDCNGDGTVSHPPLAEFTACGDPSNFECDKPDSCDGAGHCLDRLEPSGAPCGNPTDSDCNGADTCDGAGSCLANIAAPGTACGDSSSSQCDDPDTCSAGGVCLPNHATNGTACDDGLFCNVGEACNAGACAGGTARDCGDGLPCTSDVCNDTDDACENPLDAGNCLIVGVCFSEGALNPANDCEACTSASSTSDWTVRPNDSGCDDGDPCTGTGRVGIGDDVCTNGVCAGEPDPECNDDCAFAIEASVGTIFSTTGNSPIDDGEASCQPDSNSDAWFFYAATCNAPVFVSTTGSSLTPSNDTVLNVWDDCPNDGGMELACDDDSGDGLQSALVFNAVAGSTYYLRVAGFENNAGAIALNIDLVNDCVIDGTCYAAGELNPTNDCQACVPVLATTAWSTLPEGTACGDPADDECDSPDACNAAGVCETNFKPDGTVCSDDGNDCSQDFCVSGACTHPPEPEGLACGDPSDTECDNPDTCDGDGTCQDNFEASGFACGDHTMTQCDNPDVCDGAGACTDNFRPGGTPCDDGDVCTGNDECASGLCDGTPIPEAPLVEGLGSTSINVTPQPPGSAAPVALRLTSPDWTCLDKYIAADGSLVDTPVSQLPATWGTVSVPGDEIVPSSEYVVVAECGLYTSDPGSGATWLYGDHNNDSVVDFTDIELTVDAFLGFVPMPVPRLDIAPCPADGVIDFRDISATVDAFLGEPYPCDVPCP